MFKLFKRTAQIEESELEEALVKREYPKLAVYGYNISIPLKKQVAPDFGSNIIDVKRYGTHATVYFEEGMIEVPNDKIIVVRRYDKSESE